MGFSTVDITPYYTSVNQHAPNVHRMLAIRARRIFPGCRSQRAPDFLRKKARSESEVTCAALCNGLRERRLQSTSALTAIVITGLSGCGSATGPMKVASITETIFILMPLFSSHDLDAKAMASQI